MRNIFWFILTLIIAAGVFYFISGKNQHSLKDSTEIMQKKADIFYCPMHPHYTSDKPGNCPICGMNLVKRKESSSEMQKSSQAGTSAVEGYAAVHIDEYQRQLIGVKTAVVVRKPLVKTIRVPGYVAHDVELYEAQLNYVKEWREFYARYVRKSVRRDSSESWREYYLMPSSSLRPRSEDYLDAQSRLIKLKYELIHMGLTEGEIENLRKIKYGQPWVQPNFQFFQEGHPFLIYAQIFEDDIGYIDVGQKASIEVPAYHETYEGIVRSISGGVDPQTRTVRVIVEITKLRSELKADMLVNVSFPVELNAGLIVPHEAVMDTGERKIVFVENSQGVFEPREVKSNMISGDDVLVDQGLKEGDKVVVDGNFLIDSESRLKASFDESSSGGHEHGQ